MLRSLKKIFENSEVSSNEELKEDLSILCGLMIEAANTIEKVHWLPSTVTFRRIALKDVDSENGWFR